MELKSHWNHVFNSKKETEVSWHQKLPQSSIDFLLNYNPPKQANIIDVGCGDSYFIDYLVAEGYQNIYALDISEQALERLRIRLGENAKRVNWIVSDILDYRPGIKFSFWHDRASFHFQTSSKSIKSYAALVCNLVEPGGIMAIGTFAESGPEKCSGLDVTRYSEESMNAVFQKDFDKEACFHQKHKTPFATDQDFIFCTFKRKTMGESC